MSNWSDGCRLALVTGGAASGKSALAEHICCGWGGPLVYIATMQSYGREARARIAKHRTARAGKGFDTVECPHSLETLVLAGRFRTALLEDLGNLAANQIFAADTPADEAAQVLLDGIAALAAQVDGLVIVANEIFSGAERFSGDMEGYLRCLGRVHQALALHAALVVESVCGIPVVLHGKHPDLSKSIYPH